MRIVVDLQALQSAPNARRGIGRYARALVDALLRNAPQDEFILLMNGMSGEDNERLRRELALVGPHVRVRFWTAARPAGFFAPADHQEAARAIREAVIADCAPDMVLVTSLFEGLADDCVTDVGACPTAVILFDLIPLLFPDIYLADPHVRQWYEGKVEALKRADLLLAISQSAASDAVAHLGVPAERVLSIGTDADAHFAPRAVDAAARAALAAELGLTRPFLMYTGGIDHRKNIAGLVDAFASLPRSLTNAHQLAIVCHAREEDRTRIHEQARAAGLPEDAVVVTGYVPDATLVTLYNACTAFVFPSWYEGFGLPVLEAMRCGAPVIGSNVSSVPEVIGRPDALFDPHSTADMAGMMEKVLSDGAFRQSLRDGAPAQAALFSWDGTARRALDAMRQSVRERARAAAPPADVAQRKPRLAFVSPLPPQRSGISFYSADLLPALASYYEIDLIATEPDTVEPELRARFAVRDVQWLRDHGNAYDRIVYQFGNSHFHAHMFDLLDAFPGVVVLHDFYLSNLERHIDPTRFTRLLAQTHGYHAVLDRYDTAEGRDGSTEAVHAWPTNTRALAAAEGVIVHSDHSRELARRFYLPSTVADWAVIPLVRVPCDVSAAARAEARRELGLGEDEVLICSFGHQSRNKLPDRLIEGLLCSAHVANPKLRLAIVGEAGDLGPGLLARVADTPATGRVEIVGWTSPDIYTRYLRAADIAVQLRSNSRGESSAAVMDAQNYGLPVIVNAHGTLADLPADTVLRIADTFTDAELARAIDRLVDDPELRQRIGTAARRLIATEHSPDACARAYHQAIEAFSQRPNAGGKALMARLAALPANPPRDATLIQAVADSLPSGARQRQVLVDVSELVRTDAGTGIQRVVRAILNEWLRTPPMGWRVEPVYADPELGRYRYARRFICRFLDMPDDWASDDPIDLFPGDLFVGIDLQPHLVPQMETALAAMAAAGVGIAFVVYDLLPLLLPHHFGETRAIFERWVRTVSRHDRLICISQAVADEVRTYLTAHPPATGLMPTIGWFHLGADIESAANRSEAGDPAEVALDLSFHGPSFLMVGTVEPRKGHALALDAFERFWAAGGEATLVIVGKRGWNVDALCARMRGHGEQGRRLIWLDHASDAMLEQLYGSCSCLLAASEGEGFGLPLIEAARRDLPILARDIPVFREVAGEHATFFQGTGPAALHRALDAWLADFRAGRVRRSGGLPWLTWQQSAQALWNSLADMSRP